jgi:hypothetical protein
MLPSRRRFQIPLPLRVDPEGDPLITMALTAHTLYLDAGQDALWSASLRR